MRKNFDRIREVNSKTGKPAFEVTTQFREGLSVDRAYEGALIAQKTMTDFYLDSEDTKKDKIFSITDSKKGLIKFADDFAAPNQFAVSGFELFDLTPNLPLSQFFHQGLMPIRIGGGFVETVSAMRLNFAMAKMRLAGGSTNEANVSDALPEKISVPAYAFLYGVIVGEVDWMKSSQVAYDLLGYKLETLRLSYQRELDYFAFLGNEGITGITSASDKFYGGLLNQDTTEVVGYEVAESDWNSWDVEDFINYFVRIISYLVVLNRFAAEIVPDTILFPTELWERFTQPAVVGTVGAASGAGVITSILDYIQRQLQVRTGRRFNFVELPYLSRNATKDYTTAGIVANGETEEGRIVFYRNAEKVLRMNITMPLVGGALLPSPTEFGYRQNHIAVVSTPMFIYPTSIYYLDNFATTYNVTYNLDGGTNDSGNPATFVATDLDIVLADATKASNTFDGWFLDAEFTKPITKITEKKDITLYAKFTAA
jgi:uncharacterized repeat protein (TIGR02543 family)